MGQLKALEVLCSFYDHFKQLQNPFWFEMGWGQGTLVFWLAKIYTVPYITPMFMEPFSPGATSVILKMRSELDFQDIQSSLGPFKIFGLCSQILRNVRVQGLILRLPETQDILRDPGLKAL